MPEVSLCVSCTWDQRTIDSTAQTAHEEEAARADIGVEGAENQTSPAHRWEGGQPTS